MSAAVEVNECRVFATQSGAQWWATFLLHTPAARVTTLTQSIGGGLLSVACDDRAHAEWLRDTMLDRGIPASALKVREPS